MFTVLFVPSACHIGVTAASLGAVLDPSAEHWQELEQDVVIDERKERLYLVVVVKGLVCAKGAMPSLDRYLGTEPEETAIELSRALAERFVTGWESADLMDAYDVAAQWIRATSDHPDVWGGDRLEAIQRLNRALYRGVDLDSTEVRLLLSSGFFERPLVQAVAFSREAQALVQVDWTLPPTHCAPQLDATLQSIHFQRPQISGE